MLLIQPSYRQGLPVSRTQGGEYVGAGSEPAPTPWPLGSGNLCRNDEQNLCQQHAVTGMFAFYSFYVASLRLCVRPSLAFFAMYLDRPPFSEDFLPHAKAQRRNVKSKALHFCVSSLQA